MKLHRIQAVIMRHGFEARRNFDRITDTIYLPAMDIIMWGFFTVYLTRASMLKPQTVSFLFGAIILWNLFRSFQRDIATGFLAELWSRNLINLFASPLTISEYMTGLIIVNFFKAMIGVAVAALLAWLCYAYNILPALPLLIPYMFSLIVFALAVGVVTTALIFRFTTRVQGLAWSLVGFLMPFSCVFYPLSALPKFMQAIANILPTSHAFEAMRQVLAGGGFSLWHFSWCIALDMLYMVLSICFFQWIFKSACARGLLVKVE